MPTLLEAEASNRGLRRIAGEILERHPKPAELMLVAVRRGGLPVARGLADWLRELDGAEPSRGEVDITLYRDDAATALPNPRIGPSDIPGSVAGKVVILCDDVVFTGRTVRAAIDAVLDYGRPARIELCVLVDRGGRELPVQPDYCVLRAAVGAGDRVEVRDEPAGLLALQIAAEESSQP